MSDGPTFMMKNYIGHTGMVVKKQFC